VGSTDSRMTAEPLDGCSVSLFRLRGTAAFARRWYEAHLDVQSKT
jgi:hypothetical protein